MSMLPFLDHAENCDRCRNTPRNLCSEGYRLFTERAKRIERKYDPKRAKA